MIDNVFPIETVYSRPQEEWEPCFRITICNLLKRSDFESLVIMMGSYMRSIGGNKLKYEESTLKQISIAVTALKLNGWLLDWTNEDPREWVTKPDGSKLW